MSKYDQNDPKMSWIQTSWIRKDIIDKLLATYPLK